MLFGGFYLVQRYNSDRVWPWHRKDQWMSLILQTGGQVLCSAYPLSPVYCLWPRSSVKCVHLKCYQVEVVNALCSAADTSWRRSRVANTGQVRQPYLGSPLAPHWQMASEKGPMVMKPSPPSLMTRCGGYLSSLGGRALALPCSRPVALSCPPLLEQQARFQGGPYCQRRHPFLVAAVHPVDKDRKQSDIGVINLPGYVKGKPETCGWEGSCC